ncbi:hypothetical protein [Nocardioides sp.]|uniref:hypothetical protein n=1 Tax=Nocardioides sp. TaxID=35761 RepID=UPI002B27196F|nr:hypothetical protein [Nocardioides sp.]
MNDVITAAVYVLGGASALVALGLVIRDEVAQDRTFGLLALTELVLLVQLVVGCVLLAGTDRDVEGVLFVSYLIGVALALPIGAFWSLAERTRSGTGVLVVAALTVLALQVRLVDIWNGGFGA